MGRLQGQLDSPLSSIGVQQAQTLADELAEGPELAAVYSSDLGRCRATAELLAKPLNLDVRVDKRLRERHFGLLQGELLGELSAVSAQAWIAFRASEHDQALPGGELAQQVLSRLLEALDDIAARHQDQRVVVVSHGETLAILRQHLANQPLHLVNSGAIANCQCLRQPWPLHAKAA